MPPTQYAQFAEAARRHLADALLLHGESRFVNADHLAGIAAECGLKAILMDYLGGVLTGNGMPSHPANPSHKYRHLPGLWSDLATTTHGLAATQFTTLIGRSNPFSAWDVGERYSDGTHIDPGRAERHLVGARTIVGLYQQAKISGVLP